MHRRQRRADLLAVMQVGRELVSAFELVDQRGRLAGNGVQQRAGRVGVRLGYRNAALREVLHQLEIERQLLARQALEQRQHELRRPVSRSTSTK